jgi:hypothetical protein
VSVLQIGRTTVTSLIDDHANFLICGPFGVGKDWPAPALDNKASRDNCSVKLAFLFIAHDLSIVEHISRRVEPLCSQEVRN